MLADLRLAKSITEELATALLALGEIPSVPEKKGYGDRPERRDHAEPGNNQGESGARKP